MWACSEAEALSQMGVSEVSRAASSGMLLGARGNSGDILSHCQQWGEFLTVKIENMTVQHHENHMDVLHRKSRKAFGSVSVASGDGLASTFRSLGADFVMKRYRLHFGSARYTAEFLRKYADGMFELIDKSYDLLYGTVPFTEKMKQMMIDNFKLIIDMRYVAVILDENGRMVAFGICFPALAGALVRLGRVTGVIRPREFRYGGGRRALPGLSQGQLAPSKDGKNGG